MDQLQGTNQNATQSLTGMKPETEDSAEKESDTHNDEIQDSGSISSTNITESRPSNLPIRPDKVNFNQSNGTTSEGHKQSDPPQAHKLSDPPQAPPTIPAQGAIAQPYIDDRNSPPSDKHSPNADMNTKDHPDTNHIEETRTPPTQIQNSTSTATTTTLHPTLQVTQSGMPTVVSPPRRIPTELPPPVLIEHFDRVNDSDVLPLEAYHVSIIPIQDMKTAPGDIILSESSSTSTTQSSSPSTTSITSTPISSTTTSSTSTKASTAPGIPSSAAPSIVPTEEQQPPSHSELPTVKTASSISTQVSQDKTQSLTTTPPPTARLSDRTEPISPRISTKPSVSVDPKPDTLSSQVEVLSTNATIIPLVPENAPAMANKTMMIVLPIALSLFIIALIAVVLVVVYRRKRQHRKDNIIRYKRYSQNGDVVIPLTSITNENYRSTPVSAHEEAIVYSQVDKTLIRPPRPTYRYKQIKTEESPEQQKHPPTTSKQDTNRNVVNHMYSSIIPNEAGTTLVENSTYEGTPASENDPPKVPARKASCDSQISSKRTPAMQRRTPGSPRRTPGSPRKEISWPIPLIDGLPCDCPGSASPRLGSRDDAPPVPPPARREGASLGRPVPPSPRPSLPSPPKSRPAPPTPPSPRVNQPSPSRRAAARHVYDPVYIPSSDAIAIGKRLDDAGYVTSRMMRMQASGRRPYEDVQVFSDLAQGSLLSTGASSTPGSSRGPPTPSPNRSPDGATASPDSPASVHDTKSESESTEPLSGDVSFDTLSSCNKVSFSIEDITKVIDESPDAKSDITEPAEVEYSIISDDYSDTDNKTENGEVEYSAIAGDYSDDDENKHREVEYSAIPGDYSDYDDENKNGEVEYSAIPGDYSDDDENKNGEVEYSVISDDYSDNENNMAASEVEYSPISNDYNNTDSNIKPPEVEYSAVPGDYGSTEDNHSVNDMDSYVPVADNSADDEKDAVYETVNF